MDISFDLKSIIIPIIYDLLNIKLPLSNDNDNNYSIPEYILNNTENLEKHIQERIVIFQSNYKESYGKDNTYLYQYINKLFNFISLLISDKNRPIIDQIHHTVVLESKLINLSNNIIYENNNNISNYYPIYTNIILLISNIINYSDKIILDIIQNNIILWSETAILLLNYSHINDGFQCKKIYATSGNIIYNLISKNLLINEILSIDNQFKFLYYLITDRSNIIRYKGFELLSHLIKTDFGKKIVFSNDLPVFENIIKKCANNILLYRECIIVKSACLDVLSSYITLLINNKNNIESNNEENLKKFEELINSIWFYKIINDTILTDGLVSPCFYYSLLKFIYKVIQLKDENILYIYSLPMWKDIFNILNNSFYDRIWQNGIKTYFPTVKSLPITIFDLFELAHHSINNKTHYIIGYQLTQGYSYKILNKMNNYVNNSYNIMSIKAQILLLKLYMQMVKIKPELIKIYYIQQYDIITNIYSILSNKIIVYYSTVHNEYAVELISICFDILSFIIPSISDISIICNNNNNILLSIFTYYINKDQPFSIQLSLCNFIYTLYSIFHEKIVYEINDDNKMKLNNLSVTLFELWRNLIGQFHNEFKSPSTNIPIFNTLKKVSKSIQVLSQYDIICKYELLNVYIYILFIYI